jgi:hypothetical protein
MTSKAKMTKVQKTILFLLTLTGLCLLCSLVFVSTPTNKTSSPTDPTAPPRQGVSPDALQHQGVRSIYQCRQFIRDRLVSPSSAEFSYEEAYKVNGKPLNYHAVTGVVESQNRMGVLLRSEYRCDAHYVPNDPTRWVLDYLDIED